MEITNEAIDAVRKKGYRPGVVGVFVNSNKVLLLNKAGWKLWLFAQGGINNNESAHEALSREMQEEIGTEFVTTWTTEPELLFEDEIDFRGDLQGSRELNLDDGTKVTMVGKHYFYFVVQTATQNIDTTKTDFDDYKWLTYNEAVELSATIYHKNKRAALVKVLDLLLSNNLIK